MTKLGPITRQTNLITEDATKPAPVMKHLLEILASPPPLSPIEQEIVRRWEAASKRMDK